MPVMISMLRGVNVGGHNKIKMHALRTVRSRTPHEMANQLWRTLSVQDSLDPENQLEGGAPGEEITGGFLRSIILEPLGNSKRFGSGSPSTISVTSKF
jgi:Protein of unknown function (DUF1697)